MKDPFLEMINVIKNKGAAFNPPSIQLGTVISPEPLVIKLGGIQIDKDNILIADYLLKDYIREYQSSSNKANWSTTSYIKYTDVFKKDDILAVLATEDNQTFIILARVVSI